MLITPQRPIASPPPCWCGQSWRAHEEPTARLEPPAGDGTPGHRDPQPETAPGHREPEPETAPGHQYVPADGIESEAFDAW